MSKGFAPLLVIFMIAVIAAIGYLVYQNSQLMQKVNNLTNIPQATQPSVQTKTYSDSKISFDYPIDWAVEKQEFAVTVSKGNYFVRFSFPDSYGPDVCLFEDQPEYNQEMTGPFGRCPGSFTDLTSSHNMHRRSDTPLHYEQNDYVTWSIYTKESASNYYVTAPPISYQSPVNFDNNMITTMDAIIESVDLK